MGRCIDRTSASPRGFEPPLPPCKGGAREDAKVSVQPASEVGQDRYFISLHGEALIRLRWRADSISPHVDESPVTVGPRDR